MKPEHLDGLLLCGSRISVLFELLNKTEFHEDKKRQAIFLALEQERAKQDEILKEAVAYSLSQTGGFLP